MQIRLIRLFLLSVTLFATVSCRKRPPERQTLPEKIPTPPEIKFSAHDQGWPPKPLGRGKAVDVPWTARMTALTGPKEAELRNTAAQDARVGTALGARFAYVTAAELDPDKQHPSGGAEAATVRLTFYSYTNNTAIEVIMRQGAVQEVIKRADYQPPEGADEIKAAIALAQQEPQLAETVKGMHATAILTFPQAGQPGYGHRVLHVSFSASGGEEEAPLYYALADLTESKVIAAGPAGKR